MTPSPKTRPILCSSPMVRALLDGRKTQTRRVVKGEALNWLDAGLTPEFVADPHNAAICPYGAPGDLLWVRETWAAQEAFDAMSPSEIGAAFAEEHGEPWCPIRYAADGKCEGSVHQWQENPLGKTRVSIHMPRWASRLTLEITDVRVERLNDCSEADALAEGVVWSDHWKGFVVPGVEHPNRDFPVLSRATARKMYAALWDTINGSGAWLGNPWVWALTFDVHRANVDAVLNARVAA